MKKTVEEILADKVSELESEKERLEEKVEELERKLEPDPWTWRQMKTLSEEDNLGLPVPRLELRYRNLDSYNVAIDYALVYEHLLGHIIFAPLGSTKTSGGSVMKETHLDTPFRDGAHIMNDMYQLKLPAFVVHGKNSRQLILDKDSAPGALLKKMNR